MSKITHLNAEQEKSNIGDNFTGFNNFTEDHHQISNQNEANLSSPLEWGLPATTVKDVPPQAGNILANLNMEADISNLNFEDFNFSSCNNFKSRISRMEDLGEYSVTYGQSGVKGGNIDETLDSNDTVRIINQRIREMEEKMGFK
jgi:hypothetical protein